MTVCLTHHMVCMETGLKILVSSKDVTLKPLRKKDRNSCHSCHNPVPQTYRFLSKSWKMLATSKFFINKE